MLNKKFAAMLETIGFLSIASIPIFALPLLKPSSSQAQPATRSTAQPAASPAFTMPSSLPTDAKINIDGSSSMSVLDQAISQDFKKKFAGSNVTLSSEGTKTAIDKLEKGEVDLASIGRPLTPEEKAQGLSSTSIGHEKIAIVVGSENPFKGNITFAQFAKIFRGEITDWSELGGQPGPIRFIDRPETSDTRQAFRSYPVFSEAEFANGKNTESLSEDSTDAMVAKLGKDGIGYAIAHQVLNRPGVQIISMHKTLPDNPKYPFSQPRGFAYKGTPNPAVQAFLGFTTATEGQNSIRTAQADGFKADRVAASGSSPAAVGGATTPTESTKVALAPDLAPAETDSQGGIPWWPLLLGIPLAGGLIWGLTKGRGGAAGVSTETPDLPPATPATPPYDPPEPAVFPGLEEPTIARSSVSIPSVESVDLPAVPASGLGTGLGAGLATGLGVAGLAGLGAVAATGMGAARKSRIILTPRNHEDAYAYWEVSDAEKNALRQQGGQTPTLKIHDVTGVDAMDEQTTNSTQRYDWDEQSQDRHVAIPAGDRDYVAELGYDTADGRWLKLARSLPVRVPAAPNIPPINPVNPVIGGAVLAGGAAISGAAAWGGNSTPTDSTVLVEPDEEDALFVDNSLFEDDTTPDATSDSTAASGIAMAGAAAGTAFTVGTQSSTAELVDSSRTHSVERCSINTLRLDMQRHVYPLDFAATDRLKQSAVSKVLEAGQYLLKIRSGGFGYGSDTSRNEPWLLLWIHGGRAINKKTGKEVISTWSSLNGYDEVLSLDVLEDTTISAFFIDTAIDDNQGEINLAVVKL
jgi:phosphate transport system substrate-binding protein